MNDVRKRRIEFGDFQTPESLALLVCKRLAEIGFRPTTVVEPTCGVGAFVLAAAQCFPDAKKILGFEVNTEYLDKLSARLPGVAGAERIRLREADFFATDWRLALSQEDGPILVLGNFPWVTNSTQGSIGSTNLPEKTNFQNHNGFDAISGKANFDISEWMLLEVLRWFQNRPGDVAMLVKTAVARKILSHAERLGGIVLDAKIIGIDAKKEFDASVEACLLIVRMGAPGAASSHDYTIYEDLDDTVGRKVGHRNGMTVGDLDRFASSEFLLGKSPQKWRSGVKHDLSSVMEFTEEAMGMKNGLGEVVDLEPTYLFPLMKGSDIGSNKEWRQKYVLVTQQFVGESTAAIELTAPKTWAYLVKHGEALDARGSTIYAKNPRFSIFGIGDYAFRPWKIAICGLYKHLRFRLVGPINGKTVMFDDTVYCLSFDTEEEAAQTLALIQSSPATDLLMSLIFWDDKRPIKTSILNVLDWTRLEHSVRAQETLF